MASHLHEAVKMVVVVKDLLCLLADVQDGIDG